MLTGFFNLRFIIPAYFIQRNSLKKCNCIVNVSFNNNYLTLTVDFQIKIDWNRIYFEPHIVSYIVMRYV